MDILLRREYLRFSIDEIFKSDEHVFSAVIIPDIESQFFPPYHLRTINFDPQLAEREFYLTIEDESSAEKLNFTSSVVQGAYYVIPTKEIRGKHIFNAKTKITTNDDIFKGHREESPYEEKGIKFKRLLSARRGFEHLSVPKKSKLNCVYLYCFNVGQGDSFLLITSNGNSYIIDTNLYYSRRYKPTRFVNEIKHILGNHRLSKKRIKGLIITHKHLDHLRGATYLLESEDFNIENFMINLNYEHPTRCVYKLLESANNNSRKCININSPGVVIEGNTIIRIVNPDRCSNNKTGAPNINDSSIAICVGFLNHSIYLTGDASYGILGRKFQGKCSGRKGEAMLKVSHHGSRTGTSISLLNLFNPRYAFISAGYSKRFKHPHRNVENLLRNHIVPNNIKISKNELHTICYKVSSKGISWGRGLC